MKALSIKQPWAWLIAAGYKDLENRSWYTRYRGRIYIHASQRPDMLAPVHRLPIPPEAVHYCRHLQLNWRMSAIIGEVDIDDCAIRSKSPWYSYQGGYAFILSNPILYKVPIYYKGQLGLFQPNDLGWAGRDGVIWKEES